MYRSGRIRIVSSKALRGGGPCSSRGERNHMPTTAVVIRALRGAGGGVAPETVRLRFEEGVKRKKKGVFRAGQLSAPRHVDHLEGHSIKTDVIPLNQEERHWKNWGNLNLRSVPMIIVQGGVLPSEEGGKMCRNAKNLNWERAGEATCPAHS